MIDLTTHLLDTTAGRPAQGVKLTLAVWQNDHWHVIAEAESDRDGRVATGIFPTLEPGRYQLSAAIGCWFKAQHIPSLYVNAQLDVELLESGHYHLPFLITPNSWSTYRGS
ncbi:hydroxyisourate hydrolase [Celerinatantimonas sp. YJH-8]|uniref:hydroxyisourate hydrolase n=1 Tax=Celerinatantimonas sp. YJH-8 TaxID=3228714 RepID=UPI0038CA54C4